MSKVEELKRYKEELKDLKATYLKFDKHLSVLDTKQDVSIDNVTKLTESIHDIVVSLKEVTKNTAQITEINKEIKDLDVYKSKVDFMSKIGYTIASLIIVSVVMTVLNSIGLGK